MRGPADFLLLIWYGDTPEDGDVHQPHPQKHQCAAAGTDWAGRHHTISPQYIQFGLPSALVL